MRFLVTQQGSFGPTRAEIASFDHFTEDGAVDSSGWFRAQVALPATLLREYYRKRTNPRLHDAMAGEAAGSMWPMCEPGSRWMKHAFNYGDVGKNVVVSAGEVTGRFTLRVDGQLRTEVESFLGVAWTSSSADPVPTIFQMSEFVLVVAVGDGLVVFQTS